MSDLVATWNIPMNDKVHVLEFEHGTKSGKRIIRMDGEEITRKNWCFKLIGSESFKFNGSSFIIHIETVEPFKYTYHLTVNGKGYEKFSKNQAKVMKCWEVIAKECYRIVLEKDTMDVWVNGEKQETANQFIEEGTEINFEFQGHIAFIRSTNSGNKREGLLYSLVVDGAEIPPVEF